MSFIRYKRFRNKEYAYEIISYWDPNTKRPKQRQIYLGSVIDKKKKIFKKKGFRQKVERLILDFGDTYLIYQFFKNTKLLNLIKSVFVEKSSYLLSLISYRLCYPSAMTYAQTWYEGNIANQLFKDTDLSSQRISEFLEMIGNEQLQRTFFKKYIASFIKAKEGVIIDTTALPNQIHFPFNAWGYNDGSIDKQIRFLFVVDKKSSLPIFYRYLPGNIVDVSSLNVTIDELKRFGVGNSFVLIDAGFFSEDNIRGLYTEKIDFLTRLPSIRKLYKELIKQEIHDLEKFKNAVRYGNRALFIKQKKIKLYGKEAYAHIILDPEKKGRDTKKFLLDMLEEGGDENEIEFEMMKKGVMVLVSSFKINKKEIVPFYYLRQTAEKLFGFSKDDLKLIPLRVHKEETLRGYLFLLFMTLIAFVFMKKKLGKEHTVEEALLTLRNLKCKVYDKEIVVQELTRQQKDIIKKLEILMPKILGI